MPVNNNFLKQYPVKITRLAPSNNLLVIILGALVALTSSVNNQEATVTKNPMEQVKLEFQMLRAKQNLISPNLTEKIRITANNCPTLYREISKIAQNFKILTPEITISELEHYKTEYKHWIIRYDRSENKLIIGNNLLDQLTMPELRNLIASEISYETCMMNNSTGKNILKAIGLELIFDIPNYLLIHAFSIYMSPVSWICYILLTPLILPTFATKEVLRKLPIAIISLLLIELIIRNALEYTLITFMASLGIATASAIILLPAILIFYGMLYLFPYIASTYAKSSLELALDKLSYLPETEILNSAIDKIEAKSKFNYYNSRHKSQIKTWCKHRRNFADALVKQSLKRQKLAAQAAAIDELVDNSSELTGLEQSALAPA
ncbi:MAG TPA: hypothetical protein VJJ81_03350 [Candidatus Babeliales bacterium]|nr:hypothetical protein [Candidatus Babeliales bacterium]